LMISMSDLHKRFGDVVAVDGVRFDAADGYVTGLLGPNGAGKTTTLRMLTGLIKPDAGRVQVDGIDVAEAPDKARQALGVLPDARGLYPRFTARESIAYFGALQGLRAQDIERNLTKLIERLEMAEIIDRRVDGFSQGQRAKVAIARALIHDPQNVVLDEPTNGLDVMMTRAMRHHIRALRDEGKCVLFSSHIMQEVSALCDVIVVVARGRVVAQGSVEAIMVQAGANSLEDAFVTLVGAEP
jgi:sodium transport system ATP-binding protein